MLDGLEAAGYDRTFEQLPAHRAGTDPAPGPAPGLGGIALDAETSTVTLPGILQVTVVAGEAWRTEVAAKAAFLAAGPPRVDAGPAVAATTFLLLVRLLHRPRHNRPTRPGPRQAATARAGRTPTSKTLRPEPAPGTTPAQ